MATADALDAGMDAHGTPAALQDGVIALRHADRPTGGARTRLSGLPRGPEVVTQYKLAVWKLIEFAELVHAAKSPEGSRAVVQGVGRASGHPRQGALT